MTEKKCSKAVRVKAASRLSYTLIDLNGANGRRNGMASMSLANPYFEVKISHSDETSINTDKESEIHKQDISDFIDKMQTKWELSPVKVDIMQGLPAHSGFGSKTTSLLAIGKAYCKLFDVDISTGDLARIADRAGTSGASVNLIDRGGYLVDGGHINPADFNDDPQRYLLPSRYAKHTLTPPVLINLPFPDWPILIIVTKGLELFGKPELDWFKATLPIPEIEAKNTAHHVLMNLSTAIAENDYRAYCKALNILTYEHHYKKEQIKIQPQGVKKMFEDAKEASEIDAICISVTGPMCYAFTREPEKALAWCELFKQQGVIENYWFSHAQNQPCDVEIIT